MEDQGSQPSVPTDDFSSLVPASHLRSGRLLRSGAGRAGFLRVQRGKEGKWGPAEAGSQRSGSLMPLFSRRRTTGGVQESHERGDRRVPGGRKGVSSRGLGRREGLQVGDRGKGATCKMAGSGEVGAQRGGWILEESWSNRVRGPNRGGPEEGPPYREGRLSAGGA